MNRQKLELNWIGKGLNPKLEPRILIEDPDNSFHASSRVTEADIFDNRIIFGDNLLALKALESELAGQVKCIYIDPPYNTRSAFPHYDDSLEHSLWLSLMQPRLEIMTRLLRDDGTLWISVDDSEAHYLKVLADEIFGRKNFVATVIWQKKHTRANDARWLSDNHDFILCIAKNKDVWQRNLLPREDESDKGYTNPDHDHRGPWASGPCHVKTPNPKDIYEVKTPSGRKIWPPAGTSWRFSRNKFDALIADNRISFGTTGNNVPRYKRFRTEVQEGLVPTTLWLRDEVGDNQDAKLEVKAFNGSDVFSTPKPEKLIQRILTIATEPGDLVLDSFAGSGTTGAVAHKMGRRYVMIELGEHVHTHIIPRLKKVVDGTDQGGISRSVDWHGGGGYRYFKLAPSLLEKDKWGQWVISRAYNPTMLTEAVCKHEGFTYCPSEIEYWNHGYSSEQDHIYVTTQTFTQERLAQISEDVGENRTLKVCCAAFRGKADAFPNLSVSKIPNSIATRCEWGRDDYSLQIAALPTAPPNEPVPAPRKNGKAGASAPSLFDAAAVEGEEVR